MERRYGADCGEPRPTHSYSQVKATRQVTEAHPVMATHQGMEDRPGRVGRLVTVVRPAMRSAPHVLFSTAICLMAQ